VLTVYTGDHRLQDGKSELIDGKLSYFSLDAGTPIPAGT